MYVCVTFSVVTVTRVLWPVCAMLLAGCLLLLNAMLAAAAAA